LEILSRLKANGFASSNVVLGIGSYTYQHVTRDTYGHAMKATYGEVAGVGQAIFKDPKTDDGLKKSAYGLLKVANRMDGHMVCEENCTWQEEGEGLLQTIFEDGVAHNLTTLKEVRGRIEAQL